MGGSGSIQGIPREARGLWASLVGQRLSDETELRREIEAYAALIEKVAREKEFFDQRSARRLARISLRILDRWDELDEGDRQLAQAAIRYFLLSEDGDDDFESPTGFDDDDAVMGAVLRHLGLESCLEDPS